MSAKASDERSDRLGDREPFVEHDGRTEMTYDHGGAPRVVIAVWAVALLALAAYFIGYGLPDLSAWGSP
jgi:hypothetical protein